MIRLRWTRPLPRLILDGAMLTGLLLAFAYWWLGNGVHEAAGAVFLVLVLRHVANNLFWWKGLRRGPPDVQRALNLVLGLLLSATLVILLASSVAISHSLAAWLPMPRIFAMQDLHWSAAYWTIALAALHMGVNWTRIAALLRGINGQRLPFQAGLAAWCAAIAMAVRGISSGTELGLWPRLRFANALSMWDFNQSVLPFFLHWAAALATLAVSAHLLLRVSEALAGLRRAGRRERP